jgi:hypothetical protein
MSSQPVRPSESSRTSAGLKGVGLLLLALGLGAASLARPDPAAPALAQLSFLPNEGPVGIRVVLEGDGLQDTRSVRFGAREATFTMVSGERVETHVPPGAESEPITLVTAAGERFTTGAPFQVTPGRPGPPAIREFWPASGPGGTELNLSGSGFAGVEEAKVAGRPAEFTLLTDTDLVLYLPPDLAASGTITLTSPFGTTSSTRAFQVTAPEG